MGAQLPGPVCLLLNALDIDGGTLCRNASPVPGPEGLQSPLSPIKSASKSKPHRVYGEHRGCVKDPLDYVGKPVYLNEHGSPECAVLVKTLAGAPSTQPDNWQKGLSLTAANVTSLEIGTPIASGWNDAGFYPNNSTGQHSGIFAGAVSNASKEVIGFTIVEQYHGLDAIKSRAVYFDPVAAGKKNTYFYRGGDYATIKW